MARNRAMLGAGSKKMGGGGMKPKAPSTPMAGKGIGAPPMSKPMGPPRPPMGGAPLPKPPGMAPPMPGGAIGASPPPPPPGGGGGIGGGAGFNSGGAILPDSSTSAVAASEDYKKGGHVGKGMGGYAKGGAVKSRHNSPGRYKS